MSRESCIYLFHRDLRDYDNTGLIYAAENYDVVYPIFILSADQIYSEHDNINKLLHQLTNQHKPPKSQVNKYFSANAFSFMLDSIVELMEKMPIEIFIGHNVEILGHLFENIRGIVALVSNEDYTPYAIRRDKAIAECCATHNINFIQTPDYVLNSPRKIKPYRVFTPYLNVAKKYKIAECKKLKPTEYAKLARMRGGLGPQHVKMARFGELAAKIRAGLEAQRQEAGRRAGLALLGAIPQNYNATRNTPAVETSRMSPHLKFGTVSPREAYFAFRAVGRSRDLVKQLYWRDFYLQLAFHFPHVLDGTNAVNTPNAVNTHEFNGQSRAIINLPIYWVDLVGETKKKFVAWCSGQTGIPIIDAAMRQLITTGWQHNRCRMLTSSFLVKDLHIDWIHGERFFALHLTDYDPANNNGGWQFAIGAGAMPFFRVFNPWEQGKKFDPEAEYIKRYCAEYKDLTPKEIHDVDLYKKTVSLRHMKKYKSLIKPIVDHSIERVVAIRLYKKNAEKKNVIDS